MRPSDVELPEAFQSGQKEWNGRSSTNPIVDQSNDISDNISLEVDSSAKDEKKAQRSKWDPRGWNPAGQMMLAVAIGAGLGAIVNATVEKRTNLAYWLGFPGTLFLRALKCLVIPLVFCSMVCSTVELSTLGLAGAVGISTFGMYMVTTILAVFTGIISCSVFQSLYSNDEADKDLSPLNAAFICAGGFADEEKNGDDGDDDSITRVLTVVAGGGLECLPLSQEHPTVDDDTDAIIDQLSANSTFGFVDVNDVVMKASEGLAERGIPETISSTFESIVTDNFTAATATPDILAIICFAIFFGFSVAKLDKYLDGEKNIVLTLCSQVNQIIALMLESVLATTPFAVASLIAGGVAMVEVSRLNHEIQSSYLALSRAHWYFTRIIFALYVGCDVHQGFF